MNSRSSLNRSSVQFLALSALTIALPAFSQIAGDFRSINSGNWNAIATWERYDGANWIGNFFPTNASAGAITVQSGNVVSNSVSVTADQIVVASGGTLQVGGNLT